MRDAREKAASIGFGLVLRGLLTRQQRQFLKAKARQGDDVYVYRSGLGGAHVNLWYYGVRYELTHRPGEESEWQSFWRATEGG